MGAVASCLRTVVSAIGSFFMAIINGIGSILMALVNGVAAICNGIITVSLLSSRLHRVAVADRSSTVHHMRSRRAIETQSLSATRAAMSPRYVVIVCS